MVCRDLETLRRDKEKDIVMFPHDLNVGFITCADLINWPFVLHVDVAAIEGGGCGIVENSLIGELDIEHRSHDEGSLSCTDGEGYVEGKDKTEDIRRVMDFNNIHTGFFRG